MTISFTNPGEIDITSLEVMGLSAKDSASPIGRFGTGLKYAVAITLRLGGNIAIWSGEKCYLFQTETLTFRGKEVKRVVISEDGSPFRALPFTLDYGQDWHPWMAFRELMSNALDEEGFASDGKLAPEAGRTTIWVSCPDIEKAYNERHLYFLPKTKPLFTTEDVEVHAWPKNVRPTTIFYRGVAIGHTQKPMLFCYNWKYAVIDESRLVASWWVQSLPRYLGLVTISTDNKDYIDQVVSCLSQYQEADPDLPNYFDPTEEFTSVMSQYQAEGLANLLNHKYLRFHYEKTKQTSLLYEKAKLSARETACFLKCKKILATHFPNWPEINIVTSLPEDALGLVADGHIYLSKKAFDMGDGTVLGTMFEELSHWKFNYQDETRKFQNYLIDTISKLMLDLHYKDSE